MYSAAIFAIIKCVRNFILVPLFQYVRINGFHILGEGFCGVSLSCFYCIFRHLFVKLSVRENFSYQMRKLIKISVLSAVFTVCYNIIKQASFLQYGRQTACKRLYIGKSLSLALRCAHKYIAQLIVQCDILRFDLTCKEHPVGNVFRFCGLER